MVMHADTMSKLDYHTQELLTKAIYHTQMAKWALYDLVPKFALLSREDPTLAQQVKLELEGILDLDS